jgi:uncharacterized protein YjbI with pentapeptide repeats
MKTSILLWRYSRGHRDFTKADLAGINLAKARLKFVLLSQANLKAANLSQAHLVGAELIYTNLQQAKLIETNLIGANLLAANLRQANLSRSRLCGALLNAVDLSDAILDEASFTGADLRAANLQGASLRGANLRGANLKAANLLQADLTGADLEGADLAGATLPGEEAEDEDANPTTIQVDTTAIQWESCPLPQPYSQGPVSSNFENGYASPLIFHELQLTEDPREAVAESRAIEAEWSALFDEPVSQPLQFKTPEEAQSRLMRSIHLRQGHDDLRRKLLQAYDQRCAITRCSVSQVLEVAYILPFCHEATHQPSNALLLRSDLHLLFDLHLLTIDPQTLTVLVAPLLMDSYYRTVVGRSLYLPRVAEYQPSLASLGEHKAACSWERGEESAWSEAYSF